MKNCCCTRFMIQIVNYSTLQIYSFREDEERKFVIKTDWTMAFYCI